MITSSSFLLIGFIFCLFALIMCVVFGQITVRKLRKKPETRDALGMEFISGWDILNVAQTLSTPRSWSKKLESTPLSFLHANSDLLFEHTNRLDRFLAFIFWIPFLMSGLLFFISIILDLFGL